MKKVKILAPDGTPWGTKIFIDGEEQRDIVSLTFQMKVGEMNSICIERVSGLEFEGDVEIEEK